MSLQFLEILPGVRNCVAKANIQPGELALISIDTTNPPDPMVVQALATVLMEKEAKVSVLYHRRVGREEMPTKTIQNAAYGSDIIFQMGRGVGLHNITGMRAMFEYGATLYGIMARKPEDFMHPGALFPIEVFAAIQRNHHERIMKGERLHLTDPKGTDFSASIDPKKRSITFHTQGPRGEVCVGRAAGFAAHITFPFGIYGLYPHGPVNGVIYPDCYGETLSGALEEEMKLTVKDQRIVDVKGGRMAEEIRAMMKRHTNADWNAEWMWGLNPKAKAPSRHAGTLHIGWGNSQVLGGPVYSTIHWDVMLLHPTFEVDGEKLIDNGKLVALNDPKVREVAKKYGNPDQILAEIPYE